MSTIRLKICKARVSQAHARTQTHTIHIAKFMWSIFITMISIVLISNLRWMGLIWVNSLNKKAPIFERYDSKNMY